MFVIQWLRWQGPVPPRVRAVDRPEVPDIECDVHGVAEVLSDDARVFPVVMNSRALQQRDCFDDMPFFGTHGWDVYDERYEPVIVLSLGQKLVIQICHAAKTNSTGRATQEQQAYATFVRVECILQAMQILTDHLVSGILSGIVLGLCRNRHRRLAASKQRNSQDRDQKYAFQFLSPSGVASTSIHCRSTAKKAITSMSAATQSMTFSHIDGPVGHEPSSQSTCGR